MPKLFKEKKLSGAGFRKRRAEKEKAGKQMSGDLMKFLTSQKPREEDAPASETVSSVEDDQVHVAMDEQSFTSVVSDQQPVTPQEAANLHDASAEKRQEVGDEQPASTSSYVPSPRLEKTVDTEGSSEAEMEQEEQCSTLETLDLSDPANWPTVLTLSLRDAIVRQGPTKQKANFYFPKDASNRHFTKANYKRQLPNGEETYRNWLVYSVKLDKVFCFCCKLFATKITNSLTSGGYDDWRNLSQTLHSHEMSHSHLVAVRDWNELSRRFGSGKTIDAAYQRFLTAETQHWQNVVKRLVAIVTYLGRQCLAFRGSNDTLHSENNGNFLQLVEMLATFDTVMQEHLKRIKNKEIVHHYLGKDIQNELIGLIAKEITKQIQH